MGDRCPNCDMPRATREDWDGRYAGGEGTHLCWASKGRCTNEVDWRARALAAEATTARLVAMGEAAAKLIVPVGEMGAYRFAGDVAVQEFRVALVECVKAGDLPSYRSE